MNSGGNRSGRVDSTCPSFAKVGPSSSSAARRRLAWRCRPTAPSWSGRPNSSFRPVLGEDGRDVTAPRHEPRLGSRPGRRRSNGSWRRDGRSAASRCGAAGAAVFTMITVHRALWLMRLGTLPSRNSLRPAIPALPTTSTSIACSSAASTIAMAGSSWITTWACPRSPATWRRVGAQLVGRAGGPGRLGGSVLGHAGVLGRSTTCTMCSSAPNASAKVAAHRTARSAVSDRSVPTMTRSIGPVICGRRAGGHPWSASWRLGAADCGAKGPRW